MGETNNIEFNTQLDHMGDSTLAIMTSALQVGDIYDIEKLMNSINDYINNNNDIEQSPMVMFTMLGELLDFGHKKAQAALKMLIIYRGDIIARGMIEEKHLQDNNIEVNDDNHPYGGVDLITKLYNMTSFKDAVTLLSNKYEEHQEGVNTILSRYGNIIDELNDLFDPSVDYLLNNQELEEWTKVKHKMVEDGVLFIMYQHYSLYQLLKGYEFTLTIDQIKEAYSSYISKRLIVQLS